jgi:hypothetical protein
MTIDLATVIAALVAAIQVVVDPRDKPGGDEMRNEEDALQQG